MAVHLNHTIVPARDPQASATFLSEILGLRRAPVRFGPFHGVELDNGVTLDYMRVRGFPFGDEVRQFLEQHDVNFIVEQNRDAQLRSLLMLDLGVHIEKLESVRYYAGFPMSAHHVISGVKAKLEKVA